ncbi:MAG: glycosyltransferase family 9 protein [Ktedonobacteraceae bacterium]|nr:glycosyltransferase family 9 protein [Ktedonobacteraceae bacterium]
MSDRMAQHASNLQAFGPQRIALFRALYLGDLLLAVPALRALRERFPQAEITLIGLPWAASFTWRYRHYLDRFVEFKGYPGIAEVAVNDELTRRFIDEQRACGYDLAVQMHGSGRTSNAFVLELCAGVTAGYYEGACPAGLTLAAPYPQDQHEIARNLGLAAMLGCTDLRPDLEFPLYEQDHAEASALLQKLSSLPQARPLIGIHPGARPPARRWPATYFAAVADHLARHFDAQILLTGSHGEEMIVQTVIEHMQTRPVNLAGQTSMGGLAALIERLDLFISNDTGPAHIACAVRCPSVTIFGPADYRRWAPPDHRLHISVRRPVACSPCGFQQCPIDHRCLRWLDPAVVISASERLLQQGRTGARSGATATLPFSGSGK